MQRHGITFFAGVPTMYWALLNALDEHTDIERLRSTLRMAVSGGASLPVQILEDFSRRFGVNILEGYGLSETSPVATFNHPHRVTKPGSIGQPRCACSTSPGSRSTESIRWGRSRYAVTTS